MSFFTKFFPKKTAPVQDLISQETLGRILDESAKIGEGRADQKAADKRRADLERRKLERKAKQICVLNIANVKDLNVILRSMEYAKYLDEDRETYALDLLYRTLEILAGENTSNQEICQKIIQAYKEIPSDDGCY